MQNQWTSSYADVKHRRMLFPDKPSGAGKLLLDYLRTQSDLPLSSARVLDIGCGNGRNSLALARIGFGKVVGFDAIPEAISDAQKNAKKENLSNVEFLVHDIRHSWPFKESDFDIAIDINTFASLDVEERDVYFHDIFKVVSSGGYIFITSYTINDGYYRQFITRDSKNANPGIEIVCTDDGIKRILYTPEELIRVFVDKSEKKLSVVSSSTHIWYGKMFDTYYKREFVSILFKYS